ncbi:hypothetical protein SRB17_26630 [Streptomyces sp. RB17]|uniref:hypothetical protein n=1 Tax=Streptomyces sp. RB17 TaxID=2585197 RepID=UPI001309414E|nr:hypothetical protein [Streptomyces sp. RB17]MQY34693.1 hypothetical protein [Streptomyces sp. RB17]
MATPVWRAIVAAGRVDASAYGHLDGATPSRDLADAVDAHIRLIQPSTAARPENADRARLAAVGSEAASFGGRLAWDKGDAEPARSGPGRPGGRHGRSPLGRLAPAASTDPRHALGPRIQYRITKAECSPGLARNHESGRDFTRRTDR